MVRRLPRSPTEAGFGGPYPTLKQAQDQADYHNRASHGRDTPRPCLVTLRLATPKPTEAVATALHRSLKTIETYRTTIKSKLGLKNPQEGLAQMAWRSVHGWGCGRDRPSRVAL